MVVCLVLANVGYFLWARGIAKHPPQHCRRACDAEARVESPDAHPPAGEPAGISASPWRATQRTLMPGMALAAPTAPSREPLADQCEALHQCRAVSRRLGSRARGHDAARRRLRSAAAGGRRRGLGGSLGVSAAARLARGGGANAGQTQGRRHRRCVGNAGPERRLRDLPGLVQRAEARAGRVWRRRRRWDSIPESPTASAPAMSTGSTST